MTDYWQLQSIRASIEEQDVKAATTITAGQVVRHDGTGVIANTTNSSATCLGIAIDTVDNSSGATGDKHVSIATCGRAKAPAVVEGEGGNAFDATIAIGDRLSLGGDGGTNVADGQGLVDGINASGTDQATDAPGLVVATALGAVGASTYDSDLEVEFDFRD